MGSFSFHFLKNMWELVFALFLLCAGMGVVVLIYVWLAWYASLYVATQRERVNSYNNKPIKLSGLSKSDFQKLPTFFCTTQAEQSSNNKKNHVEKICINSDLECVVCLDQFQDGDKCLVLPKCRHCFHVPCADLWLSQRSICPICRGTVEIINIDQHPSIGNPQNSVEINPAEEQAPEPQLDAVGNINSDSHEDGVVIEIPALGNINSDSHEDDVVIEIPS